MRGGWRLVGVGAAALASVAFVVLAAVLGALLGDALRESRADAAKGVA